MTSSTPRNNPYIIGRPIDEPELFFGQKLLFRCIKENLEQNKKVILLHGQRRTGKSSLLRCIPTFVALDEFVFVPFDLESYSRESLSSVLDALATEILDHLELNVNKITQPSITQLEKNPDIFFNQFLLQVYKELGGKKLVLLLDEFDALENHYSDSASEHLFSYLKSIVAQQNNLFIILFAGRQSEDLPNLLNVFENAQIHEIGLLNELSAKELITKPAKGVLTYDNEAVEAILELSAGHPYFTQIICFALFGRARELEKWEINRQDVEEIINIAIENAQGGLAWFWDGLSISEQVVFSAVTEAQQIANEKSWKVPEGPLTLLNSYGVLPTNTLVQATKQLAGRGFLEPTERRVQVELVRLWLVQYHPLQQEIGELEKLDQEAVAPIYEKATTLHQQGKKHEAREYYKQVLQLNPNHFSTLFTLAENYWEAKEFGKAVELYTRAYRIDPIRNKEGFWRSLFGYGCQLTEQGNFELAKEQFNQLLAIEPDNASAQDKLLEIEFKHQGDESNDLLSIRDNWFYLNSSSRKSSNKYKLFWLVAAVGLGITLFSFGVDRLSNPCSRGEEKVYGILCVADLTNISRGERTLFPSTGNVNRDRGIEAFRQKNYVEATELFYKATVADRIDPEVLIYYNNALARKQSSPFTLAAVVPADTGTTSAQKMLRGVAQAQDQFNTEGGLQGRLLEIAIANDSNSPTQAQQVAKLLAKDTSVLGVIGNLTSDTSKAALDEFDKAGLAMISPSSTSTALNSHVFFRTVPSDAASGKKLAEYVINSLKLNKVVIFYNPDSVYSTVQREAFIKNFEKLGGTVARNVDLSAPKLDADREVRESLSQDGVKAALLFPSQEYTSVTLEIARANAKLNSSFKNPNQRGLQLLGGDTLAISMTLSTGGTAIEGLVLAVPWFEQSQPSKNFLQNVQQQWGGGDQVGLLTATSFDATQALIKALSPNASRRTVLQNLRQIKLSPDETSGEPLQFTAQGEPERQAILVRVVKGEFQLVKEQP
jgi:ABC-type branched-subunit amino acid transport system substrate-binding protein